MLEFLAANWLGMVGLVSGLLCVWLLIKENILTFPIGLLYAAITVVVMYQSRLYADTLLNAYYVVMNAYGWYFWLYGGKGRRSAEQLVVGTTDNQLRWILVVLTVVGFLAMGYYFDNFTDADLAYPDSFTTVASFIAMWMSARKYLESWFVWFIVNVITVILYVIKGQQDPNLYFWAVR